MGSAKLTTGIMFKMIRLNAEYEWLISKLFSIKEQLSNFHWIDVITKSADVVFAILFLAKLFYISIQV